MPPELAWTASIPVSVQKLSLGDGFGGFGLKPGVVAGGSGEFPVVNDL